MKNEGTGVDCNMFEVRRHDPAEALFGFRLKTVHRGKRNDGKKPRRRSAWVFSDRFILVERCCRASLDDWRQSTAPAKPAGAVDSIGEGGRVPIRDRGEMEQGPRESGIATCSKSSPRSCKIIVRFSVENHRIRREKTRARKNPGTGVRGFW